MDRRDVASWTGASAPASIPRFCPYPGHPQRPHIEVFLDVTDLKLYGLEPSDLILELFWMLRVSRPDFRE